MVQTDHGYCLIIKVIMFWLHNETVPRYSKRCEAPENGSANHVMVCFFSSVQIQCTYLNKLLLGLLLA